MNIIKKLTILVVITFQFYSFFIYNFPGGRLLIKQTKLENALQEATAISDPNIIELIDAYLDPRGDIEANINQTEHFAPGIGRIISEYADETPEEKLVKYTDRVNCAINPCNNLFDKKILEDILPKVTDLRKKLMKLNPNIESDFINQFINLELKILSVLNAKYLKLDLSEIDYFFNNLNKQIKLSDEETLKYLNKKFSELFKLPNGQFIYSHFRSSVLRFMYFLKIKNKVNLYNDALFLFKKFAIFGKYYDDLQKYSNELERENYIKDKEIKESLTELDQDIIMFLQKYNLI